jgi:predicted lysophospholipase L1 biosynthesis ABC-type transport system permease subunit
LPRSISEPRFYTLLLGAFAGTALFLAALGLFGVMSYAVAQRTRELAVRLALGARQQELRRMVLREALGLGAAGLALGLGGALLLSRALTTLLYSVSPNDPATLALVGGLLLATDRARGLPAGAPRDAHRPGGRAARGLERTGRAWEARRRRARRSAG